MIHTRQSVRRERSAQARIRAGAEGARRRVLHVAFLTALCMPAACGDDGGTPPEALRFGQVGKVELVMATPIGSGNGTLEQHLSWGSTGAWSLQESISYKGVVGDESFQHNVTDLGTSATSYYDAIVRWNGAPGEDLFIDDLPSTEDLDCGSGRTRVAFTIHDEAKTQDRTWVRCAAGSLGRVDPASAGPDAAAARIVQAVLTVRRATVGDRFRSRYLGSLPFGTLDRGVESGSSLTSPKVFTDFEIWQNFWTQHAGVRPIPYVDFDSSMVVVAMVGRREEAGDSVEVRRILQVAEGTIVEYVERVPGDFCSPAGRSLVPYHVVVAPRTSPPFIYKELPLEEVPCGN